MSEVKNIPDGWIETTLGEFATVLSGSTPSTKNEMFWNGNIPWITPKDLSNQKEVFIKNGERNITELGLKNSSAKILPKNTILFTSRAPIGYIAISKNEVATNQGFKNLICDEINSHYKYFYYLMKYKTDYIEKNSSGSTFSEASASLIKSIEILLPPLPEQKSIADILTAFDDKIELLKAQNKTLEETAQTIFAEWFGKYEIGDELPEGWRVGKLGEILNIKQGKYVKSDKISDIKSKSFKYPLYGGGGIRGYLVDYNYETPQVILTCRGNGCGRIQLGENFSTISNSCMALEDVDSKLDYKYIFLLTKNIDFESVTSGSAQPQITVTNLQDFEIVVPSENILMSFNDLVNPLFQKSRINKEQIQNLTKTRDELLPRLMSGEVRVNEFKV